MKLPNISLLLFNVSLVNAKLAVYASDTSFEAYIRRRLCPSALVQHSRHLIVFVGKQPTYSADCFAVHLTDINLNTVKKLIISDHRFKFKRLHFVIATGAVSSWTNQAASNRLLQQLQQLYFGILQTEALYLVVNEPPSEKLTRWTNWLHATSEKDFSAIVVPSNTSPAYYIRPILDSCYLYRDQVFKPRNATDRARLNANSQHCHLHNRTLKVAVKSYPPFCDLIKHHNGSYTFNDDYPLESEILALLQRKFHFNVQLVVSTKSWGGFDTATRKYKGFAMSIANRTADMGLCGLTRTLMRSQLIDYTSYTYYDSLTFLSLRPRLLSRDWIITKPFAWRIWLYIGTSFALITGLLFSSSYCIKVKPNAKCFTIIVTLFRLLVGQSTNLTHWKYYHLDRLLLTIWLLVALVLRLQYSTVFYPILTLPKSERPLDAAEDLLEAIEEEDKYLLTTKTYSSIFTMSNRENNVYYRLGKYINRTQPPILYIPTLLDIMEREAGEAVAIQGRLLLRAIAARYGKWMFHIAADDLNVNVLAIGLPKRSPLLAPFNRVIGRLQETGLPEDLIQQTFEQRQPSSRQRLLQLQTVKQKYPQLAEYHFANLIQHRPVTKLKFKNVRSIFLLYLIGLFITAMAFTLELVTFLIAKYATTRTTR